MSGPKYFWQLYQFVKSKTLGVTVLRKKKRRNRYHTQLQDSNVNNTEMHVTQRSYHFHAAQPNHPCQP